MSYLPPDRHALALGYYHGRSGLPHQGHYANTVFQQYYDQAFQVGRSDGAKEALCQHIDIGTHDVA